MSDAAIPTLSISLAPNMATPEICAYAEELGYHRAWLYDTPALQLDVWITLALCAQATSTIGLGTAVLVPNLRHPLVTASAIAQMETIAPGRCSYAIGTGFTARMALGQKPLTWKYVTDYVDALQALLRGEAVEVEGQMVQMLHGPQQAPPRPIEVPIILAASGPKGTALAKQYGDRIFGVGPVPGFSWAGMLAWGTVLEDGEDPDSERVLEAAGPGAAVVFHGIYEAAGAGVDGVPGGETWRASIEAHPQELRHLEVHRGHLTALNEHDRKVMTGSQAVAFTGMSGSPAQVRERLEGAAAAGCTEVAYLPVGPDPKRELRAFIEAARS